jgi:NAD(P)-dependent dehydrogenase (short-subunit alcohol dehydrogenase family)
MSSAHSLAGQHALVTGANRGIGAAVVRSLAALGANVTLMVRDRAGAEQVAADVKTKTFIAVVPDIGNRDAVMKGCADAVAALGPVDILVNNAGSVDTVPFLKTTPELFAQMFNVHVMGAVHTAQAVIPGMLTKGTGRIVNVASVAGLAGAPYVTHYVSVKHALVGLTRALAVEFASKGITVNAVCPAYVDTELVSGSLTKIAAKTGLSEEQALAAILKDAQQPRLVTAQEVADAVVAFTLPDAGKRNGETRVLMGLDS